MDDQLPPISVRNKEAHSTIGSPQNTSNSVFVDVQNFLSECNNRLIRLEDFPFYFPDKRISHLPVLISSQRHFIYPIPETMIENAQAQTQSLCLSVGRRKTFNRYPNIKCPVVIDLLTDEQEIDTILKTKPLNQKVIVDIKTGPLNGTQNDTFDITEISNINTALIVVPNDHSAHIMDLGGKGTYYRHPRKSVNQLEVGKVTPLILAEFDGKFIPDEATKVVLGSEKIKPFIVVIFTEQFSQYSQELLGYASLMGILR